MRLPSVGAFFNLQTAMKWTRLYLLNKLRNTLHKNTNPIARNKKRNKHTAVKAICLFYMICAYLSSAFLSPLSIAHTEPEINTDE